MNSTLVIQSHRSPLPFGWLESCLRSVKNWSEQCNFDYRFLGDELFGVLPDSFAVSKLPNKVIASDLARLLVLRDALEEGYPCVIWLDADFLIFNPDDFNLPDDLYAVGREVWVQETEKQKFKVYKKVHNAFLMFREGNSLLDFYIETAERLLEQNCGGIPDQFIGPKLLTALHNVAQLPVLETAGMLSPAVIHDRLAGSGHALDLFHKNSPRAIAAANLCCSSCVQDEVDEISMNRIITSLLNSKAV